MALILLNGQPLADSLLDRGLQYGDGFFTTILLVNQSIANWSGHWQRLTESAQRLGFPTLDEQQLLIELRRAIASLKTQNEFAVAKVMITRGLGGKGYLPPTQVKCHRYVQILPFPDTVSADQRKINHQAWYLFPQQVTFSQVPTSIQPLTAGLKHLNRLENVLAQQKLSETSYSEAIMKDPNGICISGTQSSLAMIKGNQIFVPDLSASGVASTAIQFLKQVSVSYKFETRQISQQQLLDADEIFLCNAVRGVMPVSLVDKKSFDTDQASELARQWMEAMLETLI